MRIIKEGVLPSDQLFRGTCTTCKTEFECLRNEGQYESYQRDGDFLRVTCPLCKKSAVAYPAKGGSLIPEHRRQDYTWQAGSPQFIDR